MTQSDVPSLNEGGLHVALFQVIAHDRILKGPNKYRSRFGSAIMGIGDIDKDNYNGKPGVHSQKASLKFCTEVYM